MKIKHKRLQQFLNLLNYIVELDFKFNSLNYCASCFIRCNHQCWKFWQLCCRDCEDVCDWLWMMNNNPKFKIFLFMKSLCIFQSVCIFLLVTRLVPNKDKDKYFFFCLPHARKCSQSVINEDKFYTLLYTLDS